MNNSINDNGIKNYICYDVNSDDDCGIVTNRRNDNGFNNSSSNNKAITIIKVISIFMEKKIIPTPPIIFSTV